MSALIAPPHTHHTHTLSSKKASIINFFQKKLKITVGDAHGLFLLITPSNLRFWWLFLMRKCSNQADQNRYDCPPVGRGQALHTANRVAPRTPNESISRVGDMSKKPVYVWLTKNWFVGGAGGHSVSDVHCLIPPNEAKIVAILARLIATDPQYIFCL